MPTITRSETKKGTGGDIENQDGALNTGQTGGKQPSIAAVITEARISKHAATVGSCAQEQNTEQTEGIEIHIDNTSSKSSKSRMSGEKTPVTPGKGDKGPKPQSTPSKISQILKKAQGDKWSFDKLAELIQAQAEETTAKMNAKFKGVETKIGGVSTKVDEVRTEISTFSEWQKATDIRLDTLEGSKTDLIEAKAKCIRDVTRLENALTVSTNEMKSMRLKLDRTTEQLIETQAVVRKSYYENNQNGRTLRSYNLRIGNLAEPVVPDARGATNFRKPREDTKRLVAEFLIENSLFDSLDPEEAESIIDIAYRTGKVEMNKVRNVFVKFKCVDDRNHIMRQGKLKERSNNLDGKYLMDDHTPDDYSQKRRCHAIMKDLKDKDKRPSFIGGRLRTTDGFVRQKTIRDFNKNHKVEDKRKSEVTIDRLNMHLNAKDVQNKENIEDEAEDKRKAEEDKRKAEEDQRKAEEDQRKEEERKKEEEEQRKRDNGESDETQ